MTRITTTIIEAKILWTIMYWVLAGVFVPFSSMRTGVVVVEAFAATSSPSFCVTNHCRLPTTNYGSAVVASRHTRIPSRSKKTVFPSPTTTSLESAKVLPFVYTGFSGALLVKARAATCATDKIVLLAASALSFLNLSQSDNARLKSAKLACKKTLAISMDTGKEEASKEALSFRSAVRLKIVGQVVGLVRMVLARESRGLMRGAAFLLGSSFLFLANGGEGKFHHDSEGNWKPLEEQLSEQKLNATAVLFVLAALAGFRESPMNWPTALVGVVFGFLVSSK